MEVIVLCEVEVLKLWGADFEAFRGGLVYARSAYVPWASARVHALLQHNGLVRENAGLE